MDTRRGLDLFNPDRFTEAEIAEFRTSYERSHGSVLDAYEFWLENEPRVVKSHRIQAFYSASEEGRRIPLHGTLGFLHLYVVMAYDFGIEYEVRHARSLGASKRAVLQVLDLAFIHCGPRGIHRVRRSVGELLAGWPDEPADMSASFPAGWSRDPAAYAVPLDLSTGELSADELRGIRQWYTDVAGEVPAHVDFLARGRPGLLKAHLDRLRRAMDGPLPSQVYPFVRLQFEVARANPQGIRESALIGRGLGMSDDELYEAVAWGALYGGPGGMSTAAQALEGVLPEA